MQGMPYRNSDERMSFLYPENWDSGKTYNKLKPRLFTGADNDKGKKIIPLRELFIAVPTISEAFKASTNVNDALEFIFDKIYADSGNIINIKMIANNDAHSSLTFQDINVEADKFIEGDERMLKFDLTSGNTLVLNSELKFETPKAGLSSMIAIGNLKSVSVFDEMDLIKFNFLNAISGEKGDRNFKVQHLPLYGEIPKDNKKGLDFNIQRMLQSTSTPKDYTTVSEIFAGGDSKDRFTIYSEGRQKEIDEINKAKKSISGSSSASAINTTSRATETDDGRPIFYSKSERDTALLNAKINNFIKTDDHSISPVMPISLTLKVYGNNFLGIGDFFTVNFLPKHYEERVYFQIVGVDHNMGTSMWDTTYTTVMRLKSTVKYKQFGNNDDVELPIIKYDKKYLKIKAKEIADSTSPKPEIDNVAEEVLVKDVAGQYVAWFTTNTEKVIPNGISENDLPLLNSGEMIYVYNSDLDSEANKAFDEIKNQVADNVTKEKKPVVSLEKISYSAANPTALTIGSLSYWIIMSNLLLGDEVINWERVKKDGLNPIINPNTTMSLNNISAGSISVITSLPIEIRE